MGPGMIGVGGSRGWRAWRGSCPSMWWSMGGGPVFVCPGLLFVVTDCCRWWVPTPATSGVGTLVWRAHGVPGRRDTGWTYAGCFGRFILVSWTYWD